MKISEQLLCLFSGNIEEQDGRYVVEIPEREIELGEVRNGENYRVALLPQTGQSNENEEQQTTTPEPTREHDPSGPPVEEGEVRDVEIEDIGEQGDGIARVERGYVVIVPDTDTGERVSVEMETVRENVAFGEVVERLSYYE
ncbi:TRAM domain-containing protein [Natronoarchaeum rubrum]|uniref:TRAM domain-containing protein n=1 Tax=Natronoarchaeum rubrum TaxID=755311 RepID=UPI002112D46C|nr:TRAM domain-containing protein [Natronoarchaeum rubrum]